MMNVYLWLLVAIIIAAVVLVVAGTIAADESDARESTTPADRSPRAVLTRLVADARAGARSLLTSRRDRDARREEHVELAESTISVDEFFEATRTEQRAYVDVDEIQGIIQQLRPGTDRPLRPGAGRQPRPGAARPVRPLRPGADRQPLGGVDGRPHAGTGTPARSSVQTSVERPVERH